MKIIGHDKFDGGSRWLSAVAGGPLVEVSVEGSDGNGAVMLTPDQVLAVTHELTLLAKAASETLRLEES